MEFPILGSRQRAVEYLYGVFMHLYLAVTHKFNAAFIGSDLCIVRHLNGEPQATATACVNYCGVGSGYAVGNRNFTISIDFVTATACKSVGKYRLHKATCNIGCRDYTSATLELAEPIFNTILLCSVGYNKLQINALATPSCCVVQGTVVYGCLTLHRIAHIGTAPTHIHLCHSRNGHCDKH